ncbi:hypothetical protein BGX27_010510 [Mortierella sp. AM989]|nr:hypothetical protein BGX27_010510 [Mortierella sp. AM989]
MPAETKRKFQTGQPVSTRRKAKKAKLAAAQEQKVATTPSKKDLRKAARPSKPIKAAKPSVATKSYGSEDEDEDQEEEEEDQYDDEEDEAQDLEEDTADNNGDLGSEDEVDRDQDEEDEDEDQEPIGKGKKGYRKKVKKPSGKKGKIFADTDAMLSIIDQVAGKEEKRAMVKQAQMGKIKSKMSVKEQKVAEKEKAKKALIEKKIEEIKRKKTDKRKEAKHRAVEQETKASAAAGRKSVSFQ